MVADLCLDSLPADLQRYLRVRLADFDVALLPATLRSTFVQVVASSDFCLNLCLRYPDWLAQLAADLTDSLSSAEYVHRAQTACAEVRDVAGLHLALRALRQREMLRIAWRDLSGLADLAVTLAELSALADACVQAALAWLYLESCTRWGKPTGDQPLIVLALGKLGAGELNFSSDIDLIYAYPEAGETDALRPLSHSEFFTKLGRSLTQALSAPEAEGFVYRVDLRLRPYGESGPPVLDFSALEDYYQTHARDWERYAMIKARAITGGAAGARLEAMLRPFVYRRYLDFGAIEALREMKALIEREYIRKGLHDNIKLGQGGIREIEFIAQMFQLMRGGRDPQLRQRGLQPVLAALAVAGYLPSAACAELTEGYCYLRRLENRLQMLRDQQTQTLPSDSLDRLRIALSMGHATWAACYAEWQQWQTRIHQHFTWILGQSSAAAEPVAVDRWRLLWQGRFGDVEAVNWLAGQGFAAPENVLQQLSSLRTSRQVRTLTAQGATRLDRLLPLWLAELALLPEPDTVLARVLPLLERIMQRTVYLALLSEQPAARTQLLRLAAASPWIVRLLTRQPLLLDELWDTRRLFALPSAAELNSALADRLAELAPDDVEAQMDTLRHFQQIQMLHTAAADVLGVLALPEVSDRLTLTAEVLIQAVLRLAWAHLVTRHGAPRYLAAGIQHPAPFIVVAYGKFGGHELGYGSDLDLVFLYDDTGERAQTAGGLENAVFFARLAQRILHLLTTVTPAGLLYPVDTRLRPDGRAGLVVSRLSAFAAYQRTQAWVWEHQALTRARVVAGDAGLAAQFAELRAEVLSSPRDLAKLRVEVQQMRARMRAELAKANPGEFDLKQDAGGIADIEFMVQYSVLRWAGRYPELLQTTANRPLLAQLGKLGLWPVAWANAMRAAYVWLRVAVHRAALQEQAARGALDDFAELRSEVQAVWQALIETDTEENNDDSDNNGRP